MNLQEVYEKYKKVWFIVLLMSQSMYVSRHTQHRVVDEIEYVKI